MRGDEMYKEGQWGSLFENCDLTVREGDGIIRK
jgi:hypothetical protein